MKYLVGFLLLLACQPITSTKPIVYDTQTPPPVFKKRTLTLDNVAGTYIFLSSQTPREVREINPCNDYPYRFQFKLLQEGENVTGELVVLQGGYTIPELFVGGDETYKGTYKKGVLTLNVFGDSYRSDYRTQYNFTYDPVAQDLRAVWKDIPMVLIPYQGLESGTCEFSPPGYVI
jgi:hypothetical protein